MCGLPPGLTYDEQVQLAFNLDRIRWLKIDDLVQALRIASGHPAPAEYYQAIVEDSDLAASTMGSAMLSSMMKQAGTRWQ